jgi:hypothetical protein
LVDQLRHAVDKGGACHPKRWDKTQTDIRHLLLWVLAKLSLEPTCFIYHFISPIIISQHWTMCMKWSCFPLRNTTITGRLK